MAPLIFLKNRLIFGNFVALSENVQTLCVGIGEGFEFIGKSVNLIPLLNMCHNASAKEERYTAPDIWHWLAKARYHLTGLLSTHYNCSVQVTPRIEELASFFRLSCKLKFLQHLCQD